MSNARDAVPLTRDYIRQAFTPVVVGSTSPGTATYSQQSGQIHRINDWAWYSIVLQWSGHTGTGQLRVNGLPFAPFNADHPVVIRASGIVFTAGHVLQCYLSPTGDQFRVEGVNPATGAVTAVNLPASGALQLSGQYRIA